MDSPKSPTWRRGICTIKAPGNFGSPKLTGYIEEELHMIDTRETVITEALAVIDKALAEMLRRELVSSGEVADLLLDLRTLLTARQTTTVA